MYFLDLPVIRPGRDEIGRLRLLKQEQDGTGVSRNVRARVDPEETLAGVCIKSVPYDCCSWCGQNEVTCDSLSSIFYPLDYIVEKVEVRFRTLSNCNWNSADVASLCFFAVFGGAMLILIWAGLGCGQWVVQNVLLI